MHKQTPPGNSNDNLKSLSTERLYELYLLRKNTLIIDGLRESEVLTQYQGVGVTPEIRSSIRAEYARINEKTFRDEECMRLADEASSRPDCLEKNYMVKMKLRDELGLDEGKIGWWILAGGTPPTTLILSTAKKPDPELK
jgi:hypothetical protein